MKKFGKMAVVSTLALVIASTCSAAPMAMGFQSGTAYEAAAEAYAQNIENLVNTTGNAYENVTEAYPTSAINNPNAPSQYIDTTVKLGNSYLSNIFSFTNSFLRNFR